MSKPVKLGTGTMSMAGLWQTLASPDRPISGAVGNSPLTPAQEAVQDVLDRMSALTGTETDAITGFVTQMMNRGYWDGVVEMYCTALNATDMRTGFKKFTATDIGTASDAGTSGISFLADSALASKCIAADELPANGAGGILQYFTAHSGIGSAALATLSGSSEESSMQCQYRGTPTDDYTVQWASGNLLPRPLGAITLNDIMGYGCDGTDRWWTRGVEYTTDAGGITGALNTTRDFYTNGVNFTAISNALASTHAIWLLFRGGFTQQGYGEIRLMLLGLLTALGTPNVPTP